MCRALTRVLAPPPFILRLLPPPSLLRMLVSLALGSVSQFFHSSLVLVMMSRSSWKQRQRCFGVWWYFCFWLVLTLCQFWARFMLV
ncbi:unnamed protein product [Prunus armeniaca]